MSRFNFKSKIEYKNNKSGHIAYKMELEDKLITEVLTNFFSEKKYYGDNSKEVIEDIRKTIKTNPRFVANLCVFARKEMHLRTISHVICCELAYENEGKPFVRELVNKIVERVDDMTEILSYYINTYGKPIPNSLKKGIADSFLKFDEYSLAKYNRGGKVKLRDILCIVHPSPKNEEQSLRMKKVLEGTLETPNTWEVNLSKKGNNNETWEELIESGALGYMAMLRNLRNIIKANPSNIDKVYEELSEESRVIKSKQLPFRYYSAYKVLKNEGLGTSKIYDSLEDAIKISTRNVKKLTGKTLISADVSGSMSWNKISKKSDVSCAEIAVLMMAMGNYICEESITTTFDTSLYLTPMSRKNGIISNANSISANGGGTNISLPLLYLIKNKVYVDRIIILSDCEINSGYEGVCQNLVEEYKKIVNPNVWVHAIDLQGYGTQQFKGERVNLISGWSEKALEFIYKAEEGMENLREEVENYWFK